ncbi:uncharacterized protein LOC124937558 [Impatiens glandulifera]|uniref:uncharacterized protein LOC124937558 n=1 Tax=Impatiens glandulifera TaxID=253017 RepID=UPI001FB17E67|nr:uncharacterized protein LOC124937558 [Impatiens glandulifera]
MRDDDNSCETAIADSKEHDKSDKSEDASSTTLSVDDNAADYDSVLDISGRSLDFSLSTEPDESISGLYMYKNVFSLIPPWLGRHESLKTLKFFANEINLFPDEFKDFDELECLQLRISSPGLNGLDLHKIKALKELELRRVPPKASAFPSLNDIAGLTFLRKLSVCHFSIRYLPPEIGCLKNLEYLDLSFNKMKSLPAQISYLNSLVSLKVNNNRLLELPSSLSSLQRLEILDLSNNRLTSLESLKLDLMHNLRQLNVQCNKLPSHFQIPSWISCKFEANAQRPFNNESDSSVDMDVFDDVYENNDSSISEKGTSIASSSHSSGSLITNRSHVARSSRKGWKRRYYLQQKARQERLNCSRKWRNADDINKPSTARPSESNEPCKENVLESESLKETSLVMLSDNNTKEICPKAVCDELLIRVEDGGTNIVDSGEICEETENNCKEDDDESLDSIGNASDFHGKDLSSHFCNSSFTTKRHGDGDLDNPKPSKRRPVDDNSDISCKYSSTSFCGIDDHLPDGFYDAGRDRPFLPLHSYEQISCLDSREVILMDRRTDEDLDAIVLCAQALVFHFKQFNESNREDGESYFDNLQIASLLSLFVSDHFGGSDKTAIVEKARKSASGSNYRKPFVCTCPTGNNCNIGRHREQIIGGSTENILLFDLCERSLQSIKARRNSVVVPIGELQFGVCRHRALLLKYLCDRIQPPVPCELVRGYLDFSPHAWNAIAVKKGGHWIRMLVDACHPHDIREETDPEYLCRYIPLSRITVPIDAKSASLSSPPFPSLSMSNKIENQGSSTIIRCELGSIKAVAKVRTLEVNGTTSEDIRNFEKQCLGEVRILNALKKHDCIVRSYGHQLSMKWIPALDGNPEQRILQSAVLLEHIKGGSLKNYLEKLLVEGEKHVPVELALVIAKDVASALVEMHSNHIIHRDIKSENILIDLESRRPNGTAVVKLCDFDRSVPLRSLLHTCCIAHFGIPPPNVCVGTPRWMAPEVLGALHDDKTYGLEVDIWSFGCLLVELLTLQVPYAGLSESKIKELLEAGERPPLTDKQDELNLAEETEMSTPEAETTTTLKFLTDIYRKCTESNPGNRPTAENLYDMLNAHEIALADSVTAEQEA